MSRAHFLTAQLIALRDKTEGDLVWIPESDFGSDPVRGIDLVKDPVTEQTRRVLWKQLIRIRDRIARTTSLYHEFPSRFRHPYRRWWMSVLWVLDEIEKRDYELSSMVLDPPAVQRLAIFLQSWFARAPFRAK
jgi:hypothetical protein